METGSGREDLTPRFITVTTHTLPPNVEPLSFESVSGVIGESLVEALFELAATGREGFSSQGADEVEVDVLDASLDEAAPVVLLAIQADHEADAQLLLLRRVEIAVASLSREEGSHKEDPKTCYL